MVGQFSSVIAKRLSPKRGRCKLQERVPQSRHDSYEVTNGFRNEIPTRTCGFSAGYVQGLRQHDHMLWLTVVLATVARTQQQGRLIVTSGLLPCKARRMMSTQPRAPSLSTLQKDSLSTSLPLSSSHQHIFHPNNSIPFSLHNNFPIHPHHIYHNGLSQGRR